MDGKKGNRKMKRSALPIGFATIIYLFSQPAAPMEPWLFDARMEYDVGAARRPQSLEIGDLDGDGHPDLVTANSQTDNVAVFLNKGDGTYEEAVNYESGWASYHAVIDDLRRWLNTKVKIVQRGKRGRIIVEFYSTEELERIVEKIKGEYGKTSH